MTYEVKAYRKPEPEPSRKIIFTIGFTDEYGRPDEIKIAGWDMADAIEWYMFHEYGELSAITSITF